MASVATLGAPVRISPLIKFGRWTFLLAGIFYGYTRDLSLQRITRKRKEEEARLKPLIEAKRQAEIDKINKEQMAALAKEGIVFE